MRRRWERPLDTEQRASLQIVVTMRWALIAAALFVVNYRRGTDLEESAILNGLVLAGAALNAVLQGSLRDGRPIANGLPALAGLYDAAAITGAIARADGFDNPGFLLYYPALLAFSLAFRGRWSLLYSIAILGGYALVSLLSPSSFNPRSITDQKALVLRLGTMAATVLIANVTVKIERQRRRRAVAAEGERAAEVLALEQQAREAERAAQAARQRVSQEIHDGIAQGIYMLAIGLETNAELLARQSGDPRVQERMGALVRLAKGTLLETRNLLTDLEPVMTGERGLAGLVQNQTAEFAAVTGIAVDVVVEGEERSLNPVHVGELYQLLREALANVYKHARATCVTVRLSYGAAALTLTVVDDGVGLPATPARRGRGLANMRERAARLGGRLTIEPDAGGGTRLLVTLPYTMESAGVNVCHRPGEDVQAASAEGEGEDDSGVAGRRP